VERGPRAGACNGAAPKAFRRGAQRNRFSREDPGVEMR
jgi:hypothetical protein